jgi:hypothetical protein
MSGFLLAEFTSAPDLAAAAHAAREAGHPALDALTPEPVKGVAATLAPPAGEPPIGWVMFIAAVIGACLGYFMQWFSAVVDYPTISGRRPAHSWQVFLLVPYETAILAAAIVGVLGWLYMCGLPRPHHPLFEAPITLRASQDRYLLVFRKARGLAAWITAHLTPAALHEAEP